MKNNNYIEELTFHLYDNIKRFQINVDESLAITLALIYVIYAKQENFISAVEPKSNDCVKNYNSAIDWITDDIINNFNANFITQKTSEYIINNIREYDRYYKLPRESIRIAIEKLITEKNPLLQSSNRKTADFTQRIITSISSKLVKSGKYIDIAIGTGSLLKDFSGDLYGIDINPKMVIIARVYLFFCGKYKRLENSHWKANITQADAIDDYISYKNDNRNIILFDPPMGDLRQYPKSDKWQNTTVLEHKKPNKLQSELLFLLSFLINSNNNDYFIGLFPENILNKNNKEYNSIRKYLIKNSLIAVIKVLTPHILLIGQKKLEIKQYPNIPVIRIQKDLNNNQIESFSSEILKGKDFDFEQCLSTTSLEKNNNVEKYNNDFKTINYTIYERNSLSKNHYIINLPLEISYENINKKYLQSPTTLLKSLQENEDKIKELMQNLSENVINIKESDATNTKPEKQLWFNKEYENKNPIVIEALQYFNKMGYQLDDSNLDNYQDFQIRNNINKETFRHLNTLFADGRIKLLKAKAKIYFGEKENLKIKDINWENFYETFNPCKDKEINDLYSRLDDNAKRIFEDLCKYYMLNQDEEKTLLKQQKFPSKEFVRCLKVLEAIGLAIFDKRKITISNPEHSDVDLYNRYVPNIKYIDAINFEEKQDV